MKKIFLTLISVLLLVSFVLCSCGENENNEVQDNEVNMEELFG